MQRLSSSPLFLMNFKAVDGGKVEFGFKNWEEEGRGGKRRIDWL